MLGTFNPQPLMFCLFYIESIFYIKGCNTVPFYVSLIYMNIKYVCNITYGINANYSENISNMREYMYIYKCTDANHIRIIIDDILRMYLRYPLSVTVAGK